MGVGLPLYRCIGYSSRLTMQFFEFTLLPKAWMPWLLQYPKAVMGVGLPCYTSRFTTQFFEFTLFVSNREGMCLFLLGVVFPGYGCLGHSSPLTIQVFEFTSFVSNRESMCSFYLLDGEFCCLLTFKDIIVLVGSLGEAIQVHWHSIPFHVTCNIVCHWFSGQSCPI